MKILLIQLARFGDIFQSWPTVQALKRSYPNCEVHVLVRSKFSGGLKLLPSVDRIWALDSQKVIDPLLKDNYVSSLKQIQDMVSELSQEKYDHIVNLTFSSFSSYLTTKINSKSKRGYLRYKDGTPAFGDQHSCYFYSQVGVGESNRLHVCDLFASVAGVTLKQEDWNFRSLFSLPSREKYIVIHLGASHPKKCLPIQTWVEVIRHLQAQRIKIRLIGAANESHLADTVIDQVGHQYVENLIGKTSFEGTFRMIANAQLFVGCDSAPLQMASLVNTRSLNISFDSVNFWETGPKASNSNILFEKQPALMKSERIITAIVGMLNNVSTVHDASISNPVDQYRTQSKNNFGWELIQYIYFKGEIPHLEKIDLDVLSLLDFCADELLKCIQRIKNNSDDSQALVGINKLEHKISSLKNTRLRPLVFWFDAQKISVPPADFKTVVIKTQHFYLKFKELTRTLLKRQSKERFHGSHQVEP